MTIMKIKNIFLTLAVAVASSACSDWFDVSPKTDIKTDDLFKDETGFQSALTGCYGNMTKDKTYGKNLTWYFLEKLVQRYDDGSAPFAGQSEHVYDYTNANYSKGIITDIWNSMYETIANVNNLIARLDKNGQEVITTPGSWELMKGEALALRAFLHFDLLRMYGPVYKEEPEKECIPYRKEFKPETSPLLSASKVLELVLADLKEADTYLAQDSVNWGNDAENPFKAYRGHRMNKYAAKALQARVLLYRGGSEDLAEAGRIAKEVIGQCGLKLVRDNFQDIAMFDETLFALHMLLMVYSTSGILSKLAAGVDFLSIEFCLYYGGVLLLLGFYAIGWQQILKRLPLTTAFSNKAVTIVWGIIWGALFFFEPITLPKAVGALLIIAGVVLFSHADGQESSVTHE